jgi:ATP-dependent DNA helicase PIF1
MSSIILNKKQQEAFNYMKEGKSIFLTGKSGSGKSSIIRRFNILYGNSKNIGLTSTTGTSALLIGGTTLHSFLGIGLGRDDVKTLSEIILKKNWIKRRWAELDILIIDEVSMLSPELFDKLEEVARIVRHSSSPFGGIQLILTGDMLQLPVVDSQEFCFQSSSWNKCIQKTVYLTEVIRQKNIEFQNCLNDVRIGELSEKSLEILNSRLGIKLKNEHGIIPTKIFSLNYEVDEYNQKQLDKLFKKDDKLTFFEYDMDFKLYSNATNKEMVIEKFKKNCIAPSHLRICKNSQVMLLTNLDLSMGLANGSRGVIVDFIEDLPLVRFLNGEQRIIDYHCWEYNEHKTKILDAFQIPLKVSFGISAHKVQGISLDYAEIDLENIFEYGQAYVALSRVKTLEGLSISKMNINKIKAHPVALKFYKDLEYFECHSPTEAVVLNPSSETESKDCI